MTGLRNAQVSDRPPSPPLENAPQLPNQPTAAGAFADGEISGAAQTCPSPIEAICPGQGTPGQTLLPTMPDSSDGAPNEKRSGFKGSGSKEKRRVSKEKKGSKENANEFISLGEAEDMVTLKKDREAEEAKLIETREKEQAIQKVGARQAAIGPDDESKSASRKFVTTWITWWPFDSFIGMCIVMNAVTIGAESQANATKSEIPVWVSVLEHVFLVIYTVEIVLRLYADRLRAFRSHWVKFDFSLVIVGLSNFALTLALAGKSPEELSQVMMIRMLRLARLARAVRLMVQFKVLWQLVRGLMASVNMLIWVCLLTMIIIYVFALLGLELIAHDDSMPADFNHAASFFNSGLMKSIITLLGITFYQGGSVYRTMAMEKPLLTVYFLSYHLIVGIALLGLVIGIMCKDAIAQTKADQESVKAWDEARKKKLMPKLKATFLELDTDGGGTVSMEELRDAPPALLEQMQEIAQLDDIEEFFKMLDANNEGEIQIGDFCEGLLKNGDDKPMELLVIMKQCSKTSAQLKEIQERHGELCAHIEQLETRLSTMTADVGVQLANLQRGVDFIVKCLSHGSVPRGARADTLQTENREMIAAREMEVFDTLPLSPTGFKLDPPLVPPAGFALFTSCSNESSPKQIVHESEGPQAPIEDSGDRRSPMTQDELDAIRGANCDADAEEERLAAKREEELAIAKYGVRGAAAMRGINGNADMRSACQIKVTKFITWWPFDSFIGIMIMLNAVTIGVESESAATKSDIPLWVQVLEYIFFVVYTVELSLRVYAFRCEAFKSDWVKFDAFLVGVGFTNMGLSIALAGESPEELSKVMMVRMLRLARLARAVRLMVQFKVLWQLVRGLMASAGMLFWVIVVMLAVIYVFAILAVELITEDPDASWDYQDASKLIRRGVGSSVLVLISVAFPGGRYFIPLCWEKPLLIMYFLIFLMIVIVSLFSLVVALMAQAAIESAKDDKETERAWEDARKKGMMPKLRLMFGALDADGSGEVSLEEIQGASQEMQEQLKHISGMDDMGELFGLLDYDNGGELDIEEFCDGLLHAGTSGKPMELFVIMKQCNKILETQKSIIDEQVKLGAHIVETEYKLTGGLESQLALVQTGVAQIVESLSHSGQTIQDFSPKAKMATTTTIQGYGKDPDYPGIWQQQQLSKIGKSQEPVWDLSKHRFKIEGSLLIIEEC